MRRSLIACTLLLFLFVSKKQMLCQKSQDSPSLHPALTASAKPSSIVRTIPLTVNSGTPLQIALDNEVRLKKVGQVLHGRLAQPVYAFDHLVIPAGTEVNGRISNINGVSAKNRTLSILNVDFTPTRQIEVEFKELVLADGRHIPIHTVVTPGSGKVIKLLSAGANKKNSAIKDAASQKMDQVKKDWQEAMKQVNQPGKARRLFHYGLAQLPVHPQYIDAGTLYFAELQDPLQFGSETLPPNAASALGTLPPPGSLAHALLVTPLNSATTPQGAPVEALLSQPLFDDSHQLVLPQGTRMTGSVLQVKPARRLHHNGQLRIAFREVLLPDGATQTVDTSLQGVQAAAGENAQLDTEGGAKATSSKSRYLATGLSVSLALVGSGGKNDVGEASPVAGGATAFKLVGIVVGLVVRSHSWGIIMSAYGGSRSIYTNFLGRGQEISFPKNTAMDIGFGDRSAPPLPMHP
ncbi:MAG TPA: hypothetical protein VGG81_07815 [Edaphobacter sp.]|jgi:hypothetical protein